MERGACWATVHGLQRVGHDLATKQQQMESELDAPKDTSIHASGSGISRAQCAWYSSRTMYTEIQNEWTGELTVIFTPQC